MLAIKASEGALEKFNDMKLGKKIAYIIFEVEDSDVVVKLSAEKKDLDENYLDAFIKEVKGTGQPRFAVVDWNHKLLFVSWVPDNARAQLKMKYASCKEGFVQELVGIQIKLQATDDAELSAEAIEEKVKSNV